MREGTDVGTMVVATDESCDCWCVRDEVKVGQAESHRAIV